MWYIYMKKEKQVNNNQNGSFEVWSTPMLGEAKEYPSAETVSQILLKGRLMKRLHATAESETEKKLLQEGIEKMLKKVKKYNFKEDRMEPNERNNASDKLALNVLLRYTLRQGSITQMTFDWILRDLIDIYGFKILQPEEMAGMLIRSGLVGKEENMLVLANKANLEPPTWYLEAMADTETPDDCADFRVNIEERCYAIDDPSTFEVDDAISIKDDWVTVHVADVSRYMSYNSELRTTAQGLATTVYFPERVLTMLPRSVIESGTLKPHPAESYMLSVAFKFDENLNVVDRKIIVGKTTNCVRITYDQVDSVTGDNGKEKQTTGSSDLPEWFNDNDAANITKLNDLAKRLRKKRDGNGALMIMRPEWYPSLTVRDPEAETLEYDVDVKLRVNTQFDSRKIVEEFMIMAGHSVAEVCLEHDIPCPYRVTTAGEDDSFYQSFSSAVKLSPVELDSEQNLESLPAMYEQGTRKLKNQKAAFYSSMCIGHVALKDTYSHFTSPLRRYPDLLLHYHLKDWLVSKNGKKSIVANESSPTASEETVINEILKKTLPVVCERVSAVSNSKKKVMQMVNETWLLRAMKRDCEKNGNEVKLYVGETNWIAASPEHSVSRGNCDYCSTMVLVDYGLMEKVYHDGRYREGMTAKATVDAVEPNSREISMRMI
eukprot:TRINITY_DN7867_c0_g1_i3.p1 TRINITY_DN7867_c0_g1~~TRINITY_DN7867_c0_g1_i3.p1  ORF type:complete len:660 (+),score=133.46 TRINITY_DN7867_c0_g1_i3:119-2098(+)